jgi:hypothetical protein
MRLQARYFGDKCREAVIGDGGICCLRHNVSEANSLPVRILLTQNAHEEECTYHVLLLLDRLTWSQGIINMLGPGAASFGDTPLNIHRDPSAAATLLMPDCIESLRMVMHALRIIITRLEYMHSECMLL